jgi:autotransporter-associated beta strand protein
MTTSFIRLRLLVAAALLLLAAQRPSLAGSATWATTPPSGDWNIAANWSPQTVPNSTTDIATFGTSSQTNLSSQSTTIRLDSLVFNSSAPSYTITFDISGYFFYGAGIVNNSGSPQSFVFLQDGDLGGGIYFFNNSGAGNMMNITSVGGTFSFNDTSSADSATFDLSSDSLQANMFFSDSSTAGDATINASAFTDIEFLDSSTGGNATLNLRSAAFASFPGSGNAEHMTGNCFGGSQTFNSQIDFEGFSSAGDGTFTTIGGSASGEQSSFILFDNMATADHATFVINGAMGAGLTATELFFMDVTTAANARITANGGVGGSDGGVIFFQDKSKGGKASITLNGNAELDIRTHKAPGVTIGSLTGPGSVLLGTNTLTIGSNNQSTTYSGVIEDTGGVSKSGAGMLILSGANLYTGNTTVNGGMLVANNKRGSATGTGSVQVQAGTLGGKGFITGTVTVGSGTGSGAFLAPSVALKQPATLTLKSTLTFKADSTYTYTLKAKRNKSQSDQVVAKGVTIESGAQFNFVGTAQGKLRQGTSFSIISNTASTPISGTFANLPDGAVISVSGNNLQASYTGGDGNDLTLTVVE